MEKKKYLIDMRTRRATATYDVRQWRESDFNTYVFLQDTLPLCTPEFWKVVNGVVVAMSAAEQQAIKDKAIADAFFKSYKCRIDCKLEDITNIAPTLALYALATKSIEIETYEEDGIVYVAAYFNHIMVAHEKLIDAHPTIFLKYARPN